MDYVRDVANLTGVGVVTNEANGVEVGTFRYSIRITRQMHDETGLGMVPGLLDGEGRLEHVQGRNDSLYDVLIAPLVLRLEADLPDGGPTGDPRALPISLFETKSDGARFRLR